MWWSREDSQAAYQSLPWCRRHIGIDIAQLRVCPEAVIEHLDVLHHPLPCPRLCGVRVSIERFHLRWPKERAATTLSRPSPCRPISNRCPGCPWDLGTHDPLMDRRHLHTSSIRLRVSDALAPIAMCPAPTLLPHNSSVSPRRTIDVGAGLSMSASA
jgi:hypothetical protein